MFHIAFAVYGIWQLAVCVYKWKHEHLWRSWTSWLLEIVIAAADASSSNVNRIEHTSSDSYVCICADTYARSAHIQNIDTVMLIALASLQRTIYGLMLGALHRFDLQCDIISTATGESKATLVHWCCVYGVYDVVVVGGGGECVVIGARWIISFFFFLL